METLLERIAHCVEFGKINQASPYPPEMKGEPGADELVRKAIDEGYSPNDILNLACIVGMERIGQKYSEHKAFVPQMLMSAKAMSIAMQHLRPFFLSGEVKSKGTFIVGTVSGDLHDIGKNIVAMTVEGAGWNVIDLGVDVKTEKFLETMQQHEGSVIGLSAMLTTTMGNMESIVKTLKTARANVKILIGGAPVNQNFCKKIKADFYSPDPIGAVRFLEQVGVN